ncbi:MAG TPA: ferrochelatase [Catalimonadaceae bacterium]|nr:ferrochelatase [Catalimonadaceae bacterium]
MNTGILLVNLGTPDSTSTTDVRRYLRQFLMDSRVIDIPFLSRFLLVNGIIAPFRAPKSAAVYRNVWMKEGSPLKVYGMALEKKVQNVLGDGFIVKLGMRYMNPSIESGLEFLKKAQVDRIVVVPLFPQYASATNGSVFELTSRIMATWQTIPAFNFTGPFFNQAFFLDPIVKQIQEARTSGKFDQILFTYHGLPERQIRKGDDTKTCLSGDCCGTYHKGNALCYRAQCFETSRLIAKKAGLAETQYTTSFQSRLGRDPWIKPYTDEVIKKWPSHGIKRVLALSPSFVADCLETTEEIGSEYKEVFEAAGGEHWELLPCVNDRTDWVEGLSKWIQAFVTLPLQNTPFALTD